MEQHMYPDVTKELAQKRKELAPEIYAAFRQFGQRVFADGALPSKTLHLSSATAMPRLIPSAVAKHAATAV